MTRYNNRQYKMIKKLNVMFLYIGNLKCGGGVEKALFGIFKNAPYDRFNLTLIQTDYVAEGRLTENDVRKALRGAKVKIITIKSYRNRFLSMIRNESMLIRNLFRLGFRTPLILLYGHLINRAILKEEVNRADVIYLVGNEDIRNISPRINTVVFGSTHISDLRKGSGRFGIIKDYYRKLLYKRVNGFHFLNKNLRDNSFSSKEYDFVLPYGIETSLYEPGHVLETAEKIKFLFVARLVKSKGVSTLLEAWDGLNNENLELHIAGEGPQENIVKNGNHRNLVYHGVLTGEKLYRLYKDCDVFVFPTEGETFGLVILEALSSGLFVITSDKVKGTFDDFEKLDYLKYIKNEPSAIREAIMETIANIEEIRNDKRKKALHQYVIENYEWKIITQKLFKTFEDAFLKYNTPE